MVQNNNNKLLLHGVNVCRVAYLCNLSADSYRGASQHMSILTPEWCIAHPQLHIWTFCRLPPMVCVALPGWWAVYAGVCCLYKYIWYGLDILMSPREKTTRAPIMPSLRDEAHDGKNRRSGPSITFKVTPAGSLSSSQPGGPPCWTSPLACGLIGFAPRSLLSDHLRVHLNTNNPSIFLIVAFNDGISTRPTKRTAV